MNAIGFDVSLDLRNLMRLRLLASVSRVTAAKALTFTAERAVPAWKDANRRTFHMRRDWINKGVRLRPASAGNLNAQVGTVDRYMQRHVVGLGEEKRPAKAGALFVPLYDRISAVKTHTYYKGRMRRIAGQVRKPFLVKIGGKAFLARHKAGKNRRLDLLGVLEKSTMTKPELDALGVVSRVVNREFGPVYERLLLAWAARGGAA